MSDKNNLIDIIIFGGHGDLAFRKLMPSLYHLYTNGFLDKKSRIISLSYREMSFQKHLELVREKMLEFLPENEFDEDEFSQFCTSLELIKVDITHESDFERLATSLNRKKDRERIYYLSTSSDLFGQICRNLGHYKLISKVSRVVLEKPIGRDLASSQVINNEVLKYFQESQVYRIDHYLGKETVQNILALRFSNQLFMPLWNASNIDHVQITVAEDVGVEGRWGYYDEYGALRDMVQNHLMQLLCLVAMEPPCSLEADSVRDEKVKVVRSLRKMKVHDIENKSVRAQYEKGVIGTESVPGYKEGEGVANSMTETYAALRVDIDNWRWNGVPFYLRSGKRMKARNSEIIIKFKEVPYSIFANGGRCVEQNTLIISLQPKESITLKLMNKVPGLDEQMKLQSVELELNAPESQKRKFSAYERLLLDVIRSNPTHFMRLDEVEAAWRWVDDIVKAWKENLVPMKSYTAGTEGPTAAIAMIERDGRSWHEA